MKRFKVVLVDLNGNTVPAWVGEAFAKEGIDFVARDCKTSAELAEHAADADVVWNWGGHVITADNLSALAQCACIIRTGSGTDNIPVEAATQRGIVVANTPTAHSDAVADHAIALLFAVARNIPVLDRSLRAGVWNQKLTWPGWHLHDQTLGLVGFGHAARLVAGKLRGFEMTRLAYDPYVDEDAMLRESVRPASLEALLAESDFVTLHCPLTKETLHLIGERELRRMKPTAILINTARGPVVDEPALIRALSEGWIAAAGLDVFEKEPPDPDNPLLKMNNVVVTSHVAGKSDEDLEFCYRLSVEAALALAHGRWPRSYVNRGVKPRVNLA